MKGGGKTHFIELAKKLNIDNDLLLLVPGYSPTPMDKYGLNMHFIPLFKKNIFSYLIYEILTFFYMIRHQIKFKPDIIYCRPIYVTIFPLVIAKIFKTKIIVEENGIREDELKLRNISWIIISLAKLVEYLNCFLATKIIAVTQGTKNELIKRFRLEESKIIVIPNGANIDLFVPLKKEKCLDELSLDKSYSYVGYVGSFAPWQGVEYLIKAAPLILKKITETKFLIVGDGMKENKCKNMVKKLKLSHKFIFTGRVAYEDVPKYINASDVCVLPAANNFRNRAIGVSSLKLYEYMACERPVVVGNVKGNREVVNDSRAGFVVNSRDEKQMAKAIVKLLRDKELRQQMGKNGRKAVVSKFSWEKIAMRVLNYLKL